MPIVPHQRAGARPIRQRRCDLLPTRSAWYDPATGGEWVHGRAAPIRRAASAGDLAGARILLVEARFYEDIADALLKGATRALEEAGAAVERVSVPGSLEVAARHRDRARRRRARRQALRGRGCARLRHPRRDAAFRDRVAGIGARAARPFGARAACRSATASSPSIPTLRPGRARAPGRGRQGRRRRACGACARAPQAPRCGGLTEPMARDADPVRSARPTGAARRGSPPCRRSTRWTSPAPA